MLNAKRKMVTARWASVETNVRKRRRTSIFVFEHQFVLALNGTLRRSTKFRSIIMFFDYYKQKPVDRQTNRQTDRQTHTPSDRQTDMNTIRKTD